MIAAPSQGRANELSAAGAATGPANQQATAPPVLEKRTTRRMQRQLRQEQVKAAPGVENGQNPDSNENILNQETTNAEANDLVITQNDEKLYLIDPHKRSEPALSNEILDQIQEKAQLRSKRLAK